jgi:AbiV family abortive infection protein
MGQRLNQYRGKLSPELIAEGINVARRNALRLVEDARILCQRERYPTAAALAVLSIEESGKVSILRSLALARDQKEAEKVWREYRSHKHKNTHWTLPQLVAGGARTLEELRPLFEDSSDHPQVLDSLKQIGFYTDCLGKQHWSEPSEVIDASLAMSLVKTAELLAPGKPVSSEEIRLWIKHLAPVWKGNMGWMRTALLNWHQEMVEKGLTEDSDGFARFVGHESTPADGA